MKTKIWVAVSLVAIACLVVLSIALLPNPVKDANGQTDYQTQKSVAVDGVGVSAVDIGIVKSTPAPEIKVPVYDPSAVDEGMGEEGISPEDEANIPPGWTCDGPAYLCRGEEAEKDREREQQKWLDEQEQAKEEAEAEANAPWTCEGSGSYGDYSPEGYEGCPGR